ncbi:MAG: hypothetical protein Q4G36_05665 [Paracoccus sp. (in: a-proteobacteria)]|nr:hypothetical protein [Paracoccus sp. (in: a-proteobacteria)]
MRYFIRLLILPLLLALAACATPNRDWASDEAVRQARYVSNEPPSITLLTVIGVARGEGAHSALLINGSQRVLFDPAGSWEHPQAPARRDTSYGINDNILNFYLAYHARNIPGEHYWVSAETVYVSREVADAAIRAAEAHPSVSQSFCAMGTGQVLRQVPGFENAPVQFRPLTLLDYFRAYPGVVSRSYRDGDPSIAHDVLMRDRDGTLRPYQRRG